MSQIQSSESQRNEQNIFPDRIAIVTDEQSDEANNYRTEMTKKMTVQLSKEYSETCEVVESQIPVVFINSIITPKQAPPPLYRHQQRENPTLDKNQFVFSARLVPHVGESTLPINYTSFMTEPGDRLTQENANFYRMGEQLAMNFFTRVENRSNDGNIMQQNVSHSRMIAPHPSVFLKRCEHRQEW